MISSVFKVLGQGLVDLFVPEEEKEPHSRIAQQLRSEPTVI